MEIRQLLSFCEIVKTGSFSKASKKVFRTQPALSHQIKHLEKELNTKLFERRGKFITLTWHGELLFEVLNKFFNDLDNLRTIYEDTRHGHRGSLTIAGTNAAITYSLPQVIKKFRRQSTRIKFKFITCNYSPEVVSKVMEGVADLGIGVQVNPIPSKLDFVLWRSFDKILVANKYHPISKREKITLKDIAGYPLILHREGTVIRKDIVEVLDQNNLPYEIVMELDVSENIKKYVKMGVGISVISSHTLSKEDKEQLFHINVSHLFGKAEYGIYLRKNKYITTSMKQFLKFFTPELFDNIARDSITFANG